MTATQRRGLLWGTIAASLVGALIYAFRPQAVAVDEVIVERGELVVTVDEEGETRIRDVFVISAPVTGWVKRIEAEVGDAVVAGATVVAEIEPIDPAFLDLRSETQAEADLKAREAELSWIPIPASSLQPSRATGKHSDTGMGSGSTSSSSLSHGWYCIRSKSHSMV